MSKSFAKLRTSAKLKKTEHSFETDDIFHANSQFYNNVYLTSTIITKNVQNAWWHSQAFEYVIVIIDQSTENNPSA